MERPGQVESLRGGSSPTKIARNITGEDALKLLSMDEPGIWAIPDETRYGRSSIARHVVGYIRPNAYTNPEDNVGESGLEEAYQNVLVRGRPSWVGTVTTGEGDLPGAGLRIAPAENAPPDLVTTIDARVQLVAEQTGGTRRSARSGGHPGRGHFGNPRYGVPSFLRSEPAGPLPGGFSSSLCQPRHLRLPSRVRVEGSHHELRLGARPIPDSRDFYL